MATQPSRNPGSNVAVQRNDAGAGQVQRQSRGESWDPFSSFFRDLVGFDPFRPMLPMTVSQRGFLPSFEVKETKDAYLFRADLPGVKESDIDISLNGNQLTISGTRNVEEEHEEGDRYFAYERSYGSFTRSFVLPDGADLDNINANLKDGVLTITVPHPPERQPRKIPLGQRAPEITQKEAKGGEKH